MRRRVLAVVLAVGALGVAGPGSAQASVAPTTSTAAKPGVCWFLDWPEQRDVCVHRPGVLDLLP